MLIEKQFHKNKLELLKSIKLSEKWVFETLRGKWKEHLTLEYSIKLKLIIIKHY